MARIERLKAGDTVVEMLGAHTDRNYFSTHAPELHVQMFGAGAVQYQTNAVWMFRGERVGNLSGQVPINMEQVPDPGIELSGFADALVAGAPAGSVVPALAANTYDFDVTIDGGALQTLSIVVAPTDDYATIAALMSAQVAGGSVAFVSGAFQVTSANAGGSSVVVAAGTAGSGGGDLFAAITAQAAGNPAVTFPAPTAGTGNWVIVGPAITAALGLTIISLAALTEINFIRAIVATEGDGYAATATHWD